jgi:hypothetical protein
MSMQNTEQNTQKTIDVNELLGITNKVGRQRIYIIIDGAEEPKWSKVLQEFFGTTVPLQPRYLKAAIELIVAYALLAKAKNPIKLEDAQKYAKTLF